MTVKELATWLEAQPAISAEMRDAINALGQELLELRRDLRDIVDDADQASDQTIADLYTTADFLDDARNTAKEGLQRSAHYAA